MGTEKSFILIFPRLKENLPLGCFPFLGDFFPHLNPDPCSQSYRQCSGGNRQYQRQSTVSGAHVHLGICCAHQ